MRPCPTPLADSDPFLRRTATELLVIDPGVENVEPLLEGFPSGTDILYLRPSGNAFAQIACHLQTRSAVLSRLHVLAHGAPGVLRLAGESIDAAGLEREADTLCDIALAMSPSAEVLIYGCSVASGTEGRNFVDLLRRRLQAAVFASSTPVGSAALGGDWSAFHDAGLPFTSSARSEWRGLLADITLTAAADTHTLGAGDDLFLATSVNTLNANDVLDGGGNTDALDITADQTVVFNATTITNIERANIASGTQDITTHDQNIAGGATFTVDASYGSATIRWNGSAETDAHFYIAAGNFNDTIIGGAMADTIRAGSGDDLVSGGAGADLLVGQGSDDTLSGGTGADTLSGGLGSDFLSGQLGDDVLFGGGGNDALDAGDGADTVSGGAGNDTLSGKVGADLLYGEAGNDALMGGTGADTLSGGAGTDTLSGGAGIDILAGGDDNDTFRGSVADFDDDTITDFAKGDTLVVTGADLSALNGNAASGTITLAAGQTLTLTGLSAASGNFSATFAAGATTISVVTPPAPSSGGGSAGGGSGGGSTNDIVVTPVTPTVPATGSTPVEAKSLANNGSTGSSTALLENTNNNGNVVTATLPARSTLTSEGPTLAQQGDTAVTTLIRSIESRESPDEPALVTKARNFLDTLAETTSLDVRTIVPTTTDASLTTPIFLTGTSGASQSEAFVIDMRSLPAGSTVHLDNIEFASVIGSATVSGGLGSNFVTGDENTQRLTLGADNDTAFGGGGTDAVYGNQAADLLYGNQSDDTLYGGQDEDTLYGGQDSDIVYGNLATDLLYGNLGNDTLFGGAGDDAAYGGAGEDSVVGGEGDDALYGGKASSLEAADTLSGGAGNDSLFGGEGIDYLYGGAGSDVFVIEQNNGYDVILDFDATSGDRIDIAANLNGTEIDTFAELVANATTVDGNAEINLGADYYIRLVGVQADQLQESWFGFF